MMKTKTSNAPVSSYKIRWVPRGEYTRWPAKSVRKTFGPAALVPGEYTGRVAHISSPGRLIWEYTICSHYIKSYINITIVSFEIRN
jgi:hypothetical protein